MVNNELDTLSKSFDFTTFSQTSASLNQKHLDLS